MSRLLIPHSQSFVIDRLLDLEKIKIWQKVSHLRNVGILCRHRRGLGNNLSNLLDISNLCLKIVYIGRLELSYPKFHIRNAGFDQDLLRLERLFCT